MADSKLSALTADTAPVDADLVYTVDDVAGTPTSKKVTLADFAASAPFSSRYAPVVSSVWWSAHQFSVLAGTPTFTASQTAAAYWLLDAASQESLATCVDLSTYGWTTYDVDIHWSKRAAGTGNVRWAFRPDGPVTSGQGIDVSGSQVEVVAANPSTDVIAVTTVATGLTVGGPRGVIVRRVAADGTDTLAQDAVLLGINFRQAS